MAAPRSRTGVCLLRFVYTFGGVLGTLHIVFGDSAAGTIKQALHGCDSASIVSLGDDLSWGPIDGDLDARVRYLDAEAPMPFSWSWLCEAHEEFWQQMAEPSDERLIWVSLSNPSEQAGYLAYLQRFAATPAAVIRPDRHIPPHPAHGAPLSSGSLSVEEIANVLEHASRSNVADDKHLSRRWNELQREAALLRIVEDGALVSAPVDHYDPVLLNHAPSEWTDVARVVGSALGAAFDQQSYVNSDFLFSRVPHLVASGAFECEGELLGWTEECRRAPAKVRRARSG